MHQPTVGRWVAALTAAATAVMMVAPAAEAATTPPAATTSAAASVTAPSTMATGETPAGDRATPRFLVTPGGDPMPPNSRRTVTSLAPAPALTDGVPERIAGADRYATAAQIARQYGAANAVVVANGTTQKNGFDALSANYLAGRLGAPIVLTGGGALEPETAQAVKAVLTGSTSPAIYIMGQEDAVSAAAAAALNAIAAAVAGSDGEYIHRIAGDSRYATSALAATGSDGAQPGLVDLGQQPALPTAILASGTSNADALAAGPLSNAWGIPVLLTAQNKLPAQIAATIGALGIKQLIVLGAGDRVSDAVVRQAQAAGASRVRRVAGANRFATAAAFYRAARTTYVGPGGTHYVSDGRAFLANGVTGFADALAVGPLAARSDAPLLTVGTDSVDPTALSFLASAARTVVAVTALGTAATVGSTALIAAKSAASINILAGADGTIPPAADQNAQFVAAASELSTFDARLQLARSYLPHDGAGIGILHPYMLPGWDAAGLTQFQTCDVWIDDSLPVDQLLDIFRHEYIHVLQCRAENRGFDPGYVTTSDAAVGGVERGADAGGYLLGNDYMYYVQFGPTAGPLQTVEIATARRLLDFYKIAYHIG
jgi:putative cell wall-binding protein